MEYLSNLHILIYKLYALDIKKITVSIYADHIKFLSNKTEVICNCYYKNRIEPSYLEDLYDLKVNRNELPNCNWRFYSKTINNKRLSDTVIMLHIDGLRGDVIIGRPK